MNETEKMLKALGLKTMFDISENEMPALVKEYEVFMNHVEVLDKIDTTNVEIMAYPYEIETTFLREDEPCNTKPIEEILENAPSVKDNQIKMPKVVG
ncbi:MAG: Asp-tRNA(Asn)/Glu-tRNA(Gln) amidotransferase subunit GatC [Erysipelotrichaceae bacterium]|nr:Asp-tRNA(Asn)/Glu-tRNA(Gln) amidotransferase subunit GatC [Erysipelotrichaceae bacterium]